MDEHAAHEGFEQWIPRLNLRHLQQLRSLAGHGSISETARLMATTQPALSKWLKELEEAIGAPLFERHARGLTPTRHGQILLAHAARALNEMQRAQQNLAALDAGSSWRVLLGATPAAAPELAPNAIAAFLQRHPKARVELRDHTMRVLLEKLDEGELDIVLGSLDDFELLPGQQREVLYEEPLRLIARRGHPLLERNEPPDWNALFAHEWVLWPRSTAQRLRLDAALARAGRGPLPCAVESSSLTSNLALARDTDLLCVVSGAVARNIARPLGLVTLDFDIGASAMVGMCWRDQPLQDAATLDMLHALREAASARAALSENPR